MLTGAQIIQGLRTQVKELETALTQFKQTEHYKKIEPKLKEFVGKNSTLFDLETATIFALLGYAQEFENNRKAKEEYLKNATQIENTIRCITDQEDEGIEDIFTLVDGFIYNKNDYQEPVAEELDCQNLIKLISRDVSNTNPHFKNNILKLWCKLCYVTACDHDGLTALMHAAENGNVDVVTALLNAGAKLEAKAGLFGKTALIFAAENGHTETVETLLAAGANVNAQDKYGNTALIWAAYSGKTETVNALLQHKDIDVNAKNKNGYTALIWAAYKGNTETVNALLQHKDIDVNAKNKNGYTALSLATRHEHTEIAKIIQEAQEFREHKKSMQTVHNNLLISSSSPTIAPTTRINWESDATLGLKCAFNPNTHIEDRNLVAEHQYLS